MPTPEMVEEMLKKLDNTETPSLLERELLEIVSVCCYLDHIKWRWLRDRKDSALTNQLMLAIDHLDNVLAMASKEEDNDKD